MGFHTRGGKEGMKVYYFTKRGLLSYAILAMLIVGVIGFSLLYYSDMGIATRLTEPIYLSLIHI